MLQRSTLANERLPADGQVIEVRLGSGDWQPATYRDGEFVDAYGMPLDRRKVSGWRAAAATAAAAMNGAGASRHA